MNDRTPRAPQTGPQILAGALAGLGAAAPVLSMLGPLFDRAFALGAQYTRAAQLSALCQYAAACGGVERSARRTEVEALATSLYNRVKQDIEGTTR